MRSQATWDLNESKSKDTQRFESWRDSVLWLESKFLEYKILKMEQYQPKKASWLGEDSE